MRSGLLRTVLAASVTALSLNGCVLDMLLHDANRRPCKGLSGPARTDCLQRRGESLPFAASRTESPLTPKTE